MLNVTWLLVSREDIRRCEQYVQKEGDAIKLASLEELMEGKKDTTVVYRTQAKSK